MSPARESGLVINLTDQQQRDLASRLGLGNNPDDREVAQFVVACIGTVLQLDYETHRGNVLVLRDADGRTERQIRVQIGRTGLNVEYPDASPRPVRPPPARAERTTNDPAKPDPAKPDPAKPDPAKPD